MNVQKTKSGNRLKNDSYAPKTVHNISYNILEVNKREVCYECIRQSDRL